MFARLAALAVLVLSCACDPWWVFLPVGVPPAEFLSQCQGKDGWTDPAPPVRIYNNVYDVGTCGIVSLLVVTPDGDVLIDSGPEGAAPLVARNIEALGPRLTQVKWILSSHEHHDHAGGITELKRLTGARLAARGEARGALETGVLDPADPQYTPKPSYPGASVDRVLRDGERIELGPIVLTAHATPGHSPGSTSWTWRSCGRGGCSNIAYVDSVTAVSNDGYRFSDHPEYVAVFRRSLEAIAGLDCDILITPHPGASSLYERLSGEQPLADPQSCRRYAEKGIAALEARLAKEADGR
jgi:metallo-beta-lactamase class B